MGRPRSGGETPLWWGELGPFKNGPYEQTALRLLTRRPLTNYRKAYGILPELGGNFRLCAVDQKRPFFFRVGPFLDVLPFKGRPPYGKAPYGEASREATGTLPEVGGNFRLCVDQKRPFFLTVGPFLDLLPFKGAPYRSPYGQTALREGPLRGGFLREAPYELQESLREATGRDFTRIGREFPLVCRRPKKAVFFLRVGPFLDLLPSKGPFPLTGALTGRPPYGKAPYGEASYGKAPYELQEAYRKLRGGTLPELGGNFRLCAVDQKKAAFSYGWAVSGPSAL